MTKHLMVKYGIRRWTQVSICPHLLHSLDANTDVDPQPSCYARIDGRAF
jgi:hypothetical protein